MSWINYLLVGLGGALGSMLRGQANALIPFRTDMFSWATFSVNVIGCFFIGILWVKLEHPSHKAFWITGLLGGLTTYSGLGLELFRYFNDKNNYLGVIYGLTTLITGIFLVWLGQKLAS